MSTGPGFVIGLADGSVTDRRHVDFVHQSMSNADGGVSGAFTDVSHVRPHVRAEEE